MRNFIETVSGKDLWLPDPDPEGIDIEDIAHALSLICRFTGHIEKFYSVAEHSIHVADLVPQEDRLQALLHDATEAYLCDIATPFKAMIPQYKVLEDNLWAAIAARFEVPEVLTPAVKKADGIMLMTERDVLKPNTKRNWDHYEDLPRVPNWRPISVPPHHIERLFLKKFEEYGGKR